MRLQAIHERRHGIAATAILVGLIVAASITIARRADRGRGAFVRWIGATEGIADGEIIYRRLEDGAGMDEGYPNPPLMALILTPFHAIGAVPGAVLWTLFKGLIAAFILWRVLRWPRGEDPPFPAWAAPVLVLLSAQVIHLDLTHGNTNLLVAGVIVGALLAARTRHDVGAGILIGLGGVLKVTPLLFLPYFVWKRRWHSVAGVGIGLVLFAWLVPGLLIGFDYNHRLLAAWYDQMIAPFVSGQGIGYMQTGYMNQSFTGVMHRVFTDSVAVWENAEKGVAELRVNVLSLDSGLVTWSVRIASLLVLGVVAWATRVRRIPRSRFRHVGEWGLVFLAMLFLSERSWRTHYILLLLPQAYLLHAVTVGGAAGWRRRLGVGALIVSALTHHGAFDDLFGDDVAVHLECYGVFLWGGLALFVALALMLGGGAQPGSSARSPRPRQPA